MGLHRLIYASRADEVTKEQLSAILEASERNNPKYFVTGMLLFNSGHFVQLLEGPRNALSERFVTIAQDDRHRDVEILSFGPIESRLFADWSMNYVSQYGDPSKTVRRYTSGASFDPFDMAPNAVEQMCLEFSTLALTSPHFAAAS